MLRISLIRVQVLVIRVEAQLRLFPMARRVNEARQQVGILKGVEDGKTPTAIRLPPVNFD
jgi:hypothetical protein